MMRENVMKYFKKAGMFLLAIVMMASMAWVFDGEATVAYAATDELDYIAEPQTSLTITDDMTAPIPTTDGKETYIFAGYYKEETCVTPVKESTEDTVYKKFVPAEIMNVKAQVKQGTTVDSETTDMRLVTTVDSLAYQEVGFDVYFDGAVTPVNAKTTTVYKKILANDNGNAFGYSPEAFDTDSEYFTTVTLVNIANKNFDKTFFIKPYWKTLDGTKVYGISRIARVSDSYNGIANVPVRIYADSIEATNAVTVTYNTTNFTYQGYDLGSVDTDASVVDGENGTIACTTSQALANVNDMLVNLRFKINETASSNTTFAMAGTGACDYLCKIFSTSYYEVTDEEGNITAGGPDTSWYYEFSGETEFVVATPADLYGLAKLVNEGTDEFSGKTIYMAADITINEGTAYLNDDGSAGFTRTDGATPYEWNPIGRYKTDATYTFKGAFDGRGNTISGVYAIDKTEGGDEGWYYGLFGATSTTSVLQNFELTNSTFVSEDGNGYTGTMAMMGSIAGQISGDIKNVRSSACVVSKNGIQVGGFVGRIQPSGATSDIENCWFDGKIYTEFDTHKTVSVGGFVGTVFNTGTANLVDCHNTGSITCVYNAVSNKAHAGVAGFVGLMANNATLELNIKNCMNNGKIAVSTTDVTQYLTGVAGSIYNQNTGSSDGTSNVTMENIIISWNQEKEDEKQLPFYQASSGSVQSTNTNYEYSQPDENEDGLSDGDTYYTGHEGYATAARLGIYSYNKAKDLDDQGESLRWVVTEDGIPQLKTFCDKWIDVGWYYNEDYVIYTAEEMYGFSVMSATDNFSGDTIYLGADIKMNTGVASKWVSGDATPSRNFTPIGKTTAFAGTFDGSYNDVTHSISGLYIKDTSGKLGVGLFGQATGSIQNLKLVNSYILNSGGLQNVGSIVGYSNGCGLKNIYTDAYVVNTSSRFSVGGLVGLLQSDTISQCWFAGEVTSNGNYTGGLVGFANYDTQINNCLNTGAVKSSCTTAASVDTGGIVGVQNNGTCSVKNTINMGTVTSETIDTKVEVGAVIGDIYKASKFENVYTTNNAGGVIAGIGETLDTVGSAAITITGRPMVLASDDLVGENAYIHTELDFESVWGAVEDGTLVLRDLYDGEIIETTELEQNQKQSTDWYCNNVAYGTALSDTVPTYTVQDEADFYGMSKIVNDGMTTFAGKTVQLQDDTEYDLNEGWSVTVADDGTVTTSGTANTWTPIGTQANKFNGTFNGCGSTIKGVYVNASTTRNGLFGYAASSSNIQNFTLENSYYNVTADQVGAVVGVLEGSLKDIYVKENVAICNTKGYTGGLVGDSLGTSNNKTIKNCWFAGTINSSGTNIGGLIGRVYSGTQAVTDALYTGKIYGTYAQGYFVGGLIGTVCGSGTASPSVYLTDCVATGSVDVKTGAAVGTVVGRSITSTNATNTDRVDVHVENVYTTDAITCTATISTNYVVNGFGNMSYQYSTIYGEPIILEAGELTGEQGYINTSLDFENTWVATDDGVKLASFAEANVTNLADYQRVDLSWYYNGLIYSEGAKADGGTYDSENGKTFYQSEVDFEVSDTADMYGLAALVNNTACTSDQQSFADKNISLTASVTFNDASEGTEAKAWYEGTMTAPESWIPIGTTTYTFQGKFYGNGNTISGLYVGLSQSYIGLFGKITDATISGLRLENSYIKSKVSDTAMAGSIAGGGDGIIQDVYSDAYVQGVRIVGGLLGRVQHTDDSDTTLTMTGCCFDGVVDIDYTGTGATYTGGLIGQSFSGTTSIDTCLFSGNIDCDITYSGSGTAYGTRVGGFVSGDRDDYNGTDYPCSIQVKNSLSAGKIDVTLKPSSSSNTTPEPGYVGTVFGYFSDPNTTIENTYAVAEIEKQTGSNEPTTSYALYSRNTNTATGTLDASNSFSDKTEILTGLGSHLWTGLAFRTTDREDSGTAVWAAVKGKLPMPAELTTADLEITIEKADTDLSDQGSGTESAPYTISSVSELAGFALLSQTDTFEGKYIELTADIVVNAGESAEEWADDKAVPTLPWYQTIGNASGIKRFAGNFDGNNHTISGIALEESCTYMGLFNGTLAGSAIKNIRVENSYFNQQGEGYTGSIVGDCRGTIENVYSNAIVESTNQQVGGIVGRANGINTESKRISSAITDCWYDGSIRMTATDKKQGGGIIGTLVQGQWTLTNCLFTGEIDCAYNGDENALVGGICGIVNSPKADENNTSGDDYFESKLILDSCVSAGTITTANTDRGTGAVVGRVTASVYQDTEAGTVEEVVAHLEMTNVFATRTAAGYDIGSAETSTLTVDEVKYTATPSITGEVVWTHNDDRLIGYCKDYLAEIIEEDDESKTVQKEVKLDYSTNWILRDKGTPVPATFEDVVSKVDTTSISDEIGLSIWNAELSQATHYGSGRYVLSFGSTDDDSKDTYESYIENLEELGFTLYAGNTTKTETTALTGTAVDGVYNGIFTNATGDWVLNVLYAENTGETTITINTGVEASLSKNLTDNYDENIEDITFAMLKMTSYADNSGKTSSVEGKTLESYLYGSSYVIKLADGHFIIIDGGNVTDYEGLITYLQGLVGENAPIYVDAWVVSHQHADHFSVMQGFYENPNEGLEMYVDAFYINEPNEYTKNYLYENLSSCIEKQHRGMRTFKTSDKKTSTPVYWYQTGQRYYFNGLTMDVIQSQEQIPLSGYAYRYAGTETQLDYNTTSSMLLFTTDNGKKILTGGDATDANMKYIVKAYGSSSELLSGINVFTALHHGKGTSYVLDVTEETTNDEINTFTNYLTNSGASKFDVTLFPCSVYYDVREYNNFYPDTIHDIGAFPGAGTANIYLMECSTSYFNYGDGNVIVTLGSTVTGSQQTEETE